MNTILRVDNIEKYYVDRGNITKAINKISFDVNEEEFVGIIGPSGSGKTTLLNCISTIDYVTSGHVYIEDKDITTFKPKEIDKFKREQLGFIFQDLNLFDTLTAYENIAMSLTIQNKNYIEIDQLIRKIACKLKIKDILDKFPDEMSGGERQRVACAKAIVAQPRLIFADEPTGALDSNSSKDLLKCLENLNNELRATIILVTHDALTASYCKRILFIKDGRIFNQIFRGNSSRLEFFDRIIEIITLLGGDLNNVL